MRATPSSAPASPRSFSIQRRGRERRRARRRARHARDRPARSGADGGRHRCHRAVRRIGLRSGFRLRRASLAARARPWLPGARGTVPIVPGAIMFDLLSGGDKNWGRYPPYRELGYEAAKIAADRFRARKRGRRVGRDNRQPQRAASARPAQRRASGMTVGAIAAANAAGSVTIGDGPHFWAAPFEQDNEFGGHGWPTKFPPDALKFRSKGNLGENTTLAVVATDAKLTKAQAKRLAVMAQERIVARNLPSPHAARRRRGIRGEHGCKTACAIRCLASANSACLQPMCMARAIARGVYEATSIAIPWCAAMLA